MSIRGLIVHLGYYNASGPDSATMAQCIIYHIQPSYNPSLPHPSITATKPTSKHHIHPPNLHQNSTKTPPSPSQSIYTTRPPQTLPQSKMKIKHPSNPSPIHALRSETPKSRFPSHPYNILPPPQKKIKMPTTTAQQAQPHRFPSCV